MTSRVKPNKFNYFSGGALACIILLLSGPILNYFYTTNLSFANRAYGQVGTVEVGDGRVKIGQGQEGTVEVGDGRVKIGQGQEGTVDDELSESSSNGDEAHTPPKSTQDTKSEDSPRAHQAQPTTTTPTTTTPTTTTPTTTTPTTPIEN